MFEADRPPPGWRRRVPGCLPVATWLAAVAFAVVLGLTVGVTVGNHIVDGWDQAQEARS